MNRPEKHLDIREKLKNLKPIKASDSFMDRLQTRITEADSLNKPIHHRHKKRAGIFDNVFSILQTPWLAPAAVILVLSSIILYYTYVINNPVESNKDVTSTGPTQQSNETATPNNIPEDKTTEVKPPSEKTEIYGKESMAAKLDNESPGTKSLTETEKPLTDRDAPVKVVEPDLKLRSADENTETAPMKGPDMERKEDKQEEGNKDEKRESILSTEQGLVQKPNSIIDSSSKKLKQKSIQDKLNSLDKKNLEELKEKIKK